MPAISPLDLAVLAVIALVALAPTVISVGRKLVAGGIPIQLPGSAPAAGGDAWKKLWVQKLMELQSDLEAKPEQKPALTLCRQLIWEILGGGPTK